MSLSEAGYSYPTSCHHHRHHPENKNPDLAKAEVPKVKVQACYPPVYDPIEWPLAARDLGILCTVACRFGGTRALVFSQRGRDNTVLATAPIGPTANVLSEHSRPTAKHPIPAISGIIATLLHSVRMPPTISGERVFARQSHQIETTLFGDACFDITAPAERYQQTISLRSYPLMSAQRADKHPHRIA